MNKTSCWFIWFKQPNGYIGYETRKTYVTARKLAARFQSQGYGVRVVEQQVDAPLGPPTYDHS